VSFAARAPANIRRSADMGHPFRLDRSAYRSSGKWSTANGGANFPSPLEGEGWGLSVQPVIDHRNAQ